SGVIAIVSNVIQMIIGIGTTLVLVRIIGPDDYGVYMMAAIPLLLSVAVRDLGVSTAVVNATDLTPERATGLFWSVVLSSASVGLLLVATGPLLSMINNEPRVAALMPAVGATSFVLGVSAVHDGLLKRQMRFVAVACRDISGMLAGSIAAIAVALAWRDHWALVAQQAAIAGVGLLVCLAACPWVPGSPRILGQTLRDSGEREHILHGARTSASRFIGTLGLIADRFAIGATAGDRALGLYSQSYVWAEFPTRQVYQPLMAVVVSAFSRRQDAETERYRRAFRQVLLVLYGVTIPMLVFGVIRAELLIPVILGDKWDGAVPLFRVLCVAFLFRLVVQACKWLYLGESRSADNLKWSGMMTPVLVAAAAVGATRGAFGVAVGVAIGYGLIAPWCVWFATRRSRIRPADLVRPAGRPLVTAGCGIAAVLGVDRLLPPSSFPPAILAAEIAAFTGAAGVGWLLPGQSRSEIADCLRVLAKRFDRPEATGSINHDKGSGS
ncbi:MAG: oligosaccharide flippase family protein, partial [Planctomycetota bacterium]